MKLILQEDVDNLGHAGELVSVKPGFGRNFLLPRGLAVVANEANKRQWEHQKKEIAAKQAKLRAGAETLAKEIGAVQLVFKRKVGEQDKLYGSVTASDIAEALSAKGIKIERRALKLKDALKDLGDHTINLHLHREVIAQVKVQVAAE
ncbi:MAG: 50S ribosomal protein L9 [Myxococcaceae bacterium]